MDTTITIQAGKTIVALSGRLDTTNATDFEKQIASLYELDAPQIVFDCTNLSYISSSGLRILLALLKSVEKRKGTLELHHLRLEIKEVFDMIGFSSFFRIQ
ncbi:MAG: STAS domain-containing protein [Bacteroides sp.]